MSKVLLISPNEILGKNGGSIGQRKLYNALLKMKENNDIDDFKTISLDDFSEIKLIKTKKKDIFSRLTLHSNYLSSYKKQILKFINEYKPDVILLGNSKLGFLIHKKYANKYLTHFDNVEYDYVDSANSGSSLKKKLKRFIEHICVKKDEKKAVKYSNQLLVLSTRDYNRLEELYKTKKAYSIYPVCIDAKEVLDKANDTLGVLFVGTLNYQSNVDAAIALMRIADKSNLEKLVIAGSKPSDELTNEIQKHNNIVPFFNFNAYSDFAALGDVLASPITLGAGMKVKVAEAMSRGLLVCGSKETFVGYDEAFKLTNGLYLCETDEEYIDTISKLNKLTKEERISLAKENVKAFNALYSSEVSYAILKKAVGDQK